MGLPGVELVVIDNGSSDGTAEVARRAGARVLTHLLRRTVNFVFGASASDLLAGYRASRAAVESRGSGFSATVCQS